MRAAAIVLLSQIVLECIFILVMRYAVRADILHLGHANGNMLEESVIIFMGYGYYRLLATGLVQVIILNLRNTYKNNPSKYLKQNCIVSVILVSLFSLVYRDPWSVVIAFLIALLSSVSLIMLHRLFNAHK